MTKKNRLSTLRRLLYDVVQPSEKIGENWMHQVYVKIQGRQIYESVFFPSLPLGGFILPQPQFPLEWKVIIGCGF